MPVFDFGKQSKYNFRGLALQFNVGESLIGWTSDVMISQGPQIPTQGAFPGCLNPGAVVLAVLVSRRSTWAIIAEKDVLLSYMIHQFC